MKQITLSYEQDVVDLWNQGFSLGEISNTITHIKRDSIRSLLLKNDIDPSSRKNKSFTKERTQQIVALYHEGKPQQEIMKTCAMGAATVERVLKRAGIDPIWTSSFADYMANTTLDQLQQSLSKGSVNKTAIELGMPFWAVTQAIETYNIPFVRAFPKVAHLEPEL